ncbi:MAG: hypothetical protein MJY44_03125 [Bacteroidales bacterium]|nr:hypothetical protein [Bacteroidales bacterium]
MLKKITSILSFILSTALLCGAADSTAVKSKIITEAGLNAKIDWAGLWNGGVFDRDASGLGASVLLARLGGRITDNFTFYTRLRLSKSALGYDGKDPDRFLPWIDKLYLAYSVGDWTFRAGKNISQLGGFEIAKAPHDTYFTSSAVSSLVSYIWGLEIEKRLGEGNDVLTLQLGQSEYRNRENPNLYGAYLSYFGTHGFYSNLSSISVSAIPGGGAAGAIVLGNRFHIPGNFLVDIDFYHRSTKNALFFKDWSLMGEIRWTSPKGFIDLILRGDYDYCCKDISTFTFLAPGTSALTLGGGVEYYPVKGNRQIRIHAIYRHRPGDNCLDIGFTWNPEFVK